MPDEASPPPPLGDLPRHEAVRLRAAVTGRSRAALALDPSLTSEQAGRLAELVRRRLEGEPLQYLEATVQFGPLELAADRRALIPRPETEQLWQMAVEALGEAGRDTVIVDLCTGSGNVALALKHSFPQARVLATDISSEALSLAEENAARTGLEVELLQGDLFGPLPGSLRGRVDLLVANPPYVSESEMAALAPEVRQHEPREALVAGPSGDEMLARIAEDAGWWLGTGGHLFCEIAEMRAERARELFASWDAEIRPDLAGRSRIVMARPRPESQPSVASA
ncbi:MAG: peptide chain release factor N(5)-glutamine methyltransferase [Actinomycetota bacterium]|nr:peptide chain release factor N(5)-glutamine methyltransferase [Actinomycetota bacterium]